MRKKSGPLANPHYVGSVVEQILATLVHRPGDALTVNDLATYTGQSPASVARAVDQAVADGAPLRTTKLGRSRVVALTVDPDSSTGEYLAREVLVRQGYNADDVIDFSGAGDDQDVVFAVDPYGVRGELPIGAVRLDEIGDTDPHQAAPYLPDHLRPEDERTVFELPGESYPEQPGVTPNVGSARLLGALALGLDDQLYVMDRALTLAADTSGAHRTIDLARWVRTLATTIPQPGRVLLWAAAHAERIGQPYIGVLAAERARADLTEAFKRLTAGREYLERCAGKGDDIAAYDADLTDRAQQIEAASTDEHRAYLVREQERDQARRDELAAKTLGLSGEIGGATEEIGGDDERLLRAYLTQTIHLCEGLATDLPAPSARPRGRGRE